MQPIQQLLTIFIADLVGIASLLLAACAPASLPAQPASARPTPPAELTIPTAQPQPETEALIEEGCRRPSSLQRHEIQSTLLNAALPVSVYLPPCYDAEKEGGYPALYLLHGQTYDDSMWVNLGAADLADSHIQAGEWPPFIMVMPFEELYYRKAAGN